MTGRRWRDGAGVHPHPGGAVQGPVRLLVDGGGPPEGPDERRGPQGRGGVLRAGGEALAPRRGAGYPTGACPGASPRSWDAAPWCSSSARCRERSRSAAGGTTPTRATSSGACWRALAKTRSLGHRRRLAALNAAGGAWDAIADCARAGSPTRHPPERLNPVADLVVKHACGMSSSTGKAREFRRHVARGPPAGVRRRAPVEQPRGRVQPRRRRGARRASLASRPRPGPRTAGRRAGRT